MRYADVGKNKKSRGLAYYRRRRAIEEWRKKAKVWEVETTGFTEERKEAAKGREMWKNKKTEKLRYIQRMIQMDKKGEIPEYLRKG